MFADEMRVAHRSEVRCVEEAAEGPDGHGADEGGGVGEEALGFGCEGRIAGIADRDHDVADEAVTSGALDRRIAKQVAEGGIVETRQVFETRRGQFGAGVKLRLARHGCKAVPWAHREAIVAAIDAIAHRHAEFARNVSLVLDGEIGNAAPRIDFVRCGEGLRRADVEAAAAGTAMIRFGLVGLDLERGEDRAEEQPGAEFARDEIGVLALPAKARGGGECAKYS